VYYTVGGTAESGVDYTGLPGPTGYGDCYTAVIPQGSSSTQVTITPVAENLATGQKTVTLTLATADPYLASLGMAGSPAFVVGASTSATATIDDDYVGVDLPPVLSDDTLSMVEDHTLGLTAADFAADFQSPQGYPLQAVQITALPQNGTLSYTDPTTDEVDTISSVPCTLSPVPSTLTYTPATGYTGTDSFQWNASDGQLYATSAATMTVNVTGLQAPVVANNTVVVVENGSLSLTAADFSGNFTDADGDSLQAVQITALPADGQFSLSGAAVAVNQVISAGDLADLTYAPTTDFNGPDSFQWTATDGYSYATTPATMTLDVAPVNQPPSFTAGPNETASEDSGPQVISGWATGIADAPGNLPGQTLTFVVASDSDSGLFSSGPAVDPATGDLSFTPATHQYGTATIGLALKNSGGTANGGQNTSAVQTFTITVSEVHYAPTVSDSSQSLVENHTLAFTAADFSSQFSDLKAGDSLQGIQITQLSANGTLLLSGQAVTVGQFVPTTVVGSSGPLPADIDDLSYQPAANYTGADSFQWNAYDGTLYSASPATVSITVTAYQPPTLTNGATWVTKNGTLAFSWANFTADFSDPAGDALQAVQITSLPTDGTLSVFGNPVSAGQVIPAADLSSLTYQPGSNYLGADAITWTATDGTSYAATPATMSITVTAEPPPTVSDDSATLNVNSSLTFTVAQFAADFTDPNGGSLQAVEITALPQHGTFLLSGQAVTAGQIISAANLGNLVYQPAVDSVGADSFRWAGSDGQLFSITPATMTEFVQLPQQPAVYDAYYEMAAGHTLDFTATDFNDQFDDQGTGDDLQAVVITALPQDGIVALGGAAGCRRRGNPTCRHGKPHLSAGNQLHGRRQFPVVWLRRAGLYQLRCHGQHHYRPRTRPDCYQRHTLACREPHRCLQ
jgi:hypothetical protein